MFKLLKSEVKKAEAAANKFFGRNDCKVCSYAERLDESGLFYDVECEICYDYKEPAPHGVIVHACMFDRRRSFAAVKTW